MDECVGRFQTMSDARGVFFRTGSATIDSRSAGLLETLAGIVRRCPDLVLEVGGHTDADGSSNANQRLSERRAAAVATFLKEQGVEAERLVAKGYGEAFPVVPNTSAENKSRNRRIEFKVLQ